MGMLNNPTQALSRVEVVHPETGEVVSRKRQMYVSEQPSLTQQQFLEECDINNIIARYKVQGVVNQSSRPEMYGDFSNMPSYQEALDIVNRGADIFMSLSSEIRARFENDPAKFLEWSKDPVNKPDLIKWGLVPKEAPPSDTDRVLSKLDELKPAKQASEPPEGGVTK